MSESVQPDSQGSTSKTIPINRSGDTIPVVELLTGRGVILGKSGSGKSNTASVITEELLNEGFPVLIVDVDGEYFGLKEKYEILHLGADEECDLQVGPEHAEKIAELSLEKNIPIILDVSGYLHEEEQKELIKEVGRHLFAKEKKLRKPFLMLIEEVHEYIPESGLDETGQMLVKIAKRGRKHGLGLCGISQRPADVKKDFITQCDWLVWHRLTWENDTKVVRRVLGSDYDNRIQNLDDGEAFMLTDWNDEIRRVRFRRKETFDAGATPTLEGVERPELKSVNENLLSELQDITEKKRSERSEVERLRSELEEKEDRIEELEEELKKARDMRELAERFTEALEQSDNRGDEELQRTVEEVKTELQNLREENSRLREENERLRNQTESSESSDTELSNEEIQNEGIEYEEFIEDEAVQKAIAGAKNEATSPRYVKGVVTSIVAAGGPVTYREIADELGISSTGHVASGVNALHDRDVVTKEKDGRVTKVDLNTEKVDDIRASERRREQSEEVLSSI
jgi:DNA-binding transcriptional regulator GbsR (MarR family)